MTEDKHCESSETTDQRRAAEVDAAFKKLIDDLHSPEPMDPEELLKRCKEKKRKRAPTQRG